jgi:capsular polysaccharide biosynthesis protein
MLGRFPINKFDEPCATLGHVYRGFYHLIADSIPRIFGLHHPSLAGIPKIRLLYDRRFNVEQLEIIRSLIPNNVQLTEVPIVSRIRALNYIHLPFLSARRTDVTPVWARESLGYAPSEYLNWYRDRVLTYFGFSDSGQSLRKIYVSRRYATVRSIVNEEVLTGPLERLGFETVFLERLSLRAQAELFRSASHVVAQHGAGLTNLIYMPCGGTVIEIMSSPEKSRHFCLLAKSLGINHTFLTQQGRDKNADLVVGKALVHDILDVVGG